MLDESQTLSETQTLGEAMRPPYIATIILFVGSLLAGVGFSAVQPPFEAVDETAHYSYIQQMAETGTWPRVNDPSSADVDEYLRVAPGPILVDGRWSYSAFFKASVDTVHAGTSAIHAERERDRSWRPGARKNYEGQHPPLYYALLAPLWSVSKGWSIYAQFVLLRAVSYLFAWVGLVIATFSIARSSAGSPYAPLLVVGPALWPALFPQWFPEMARLGNDSLVLLLLALASVVIRKGFSPNGKTVHFALLGSVCGLGLLTKATVLPFVAALGLFLTWSAWRARGDAAMLRAWISRLIVFCLVTVVIAGWWYVKNQIVYGNIVGSSDAIALAKQGGLLKGLSENFSLRLTIFGLIRDVESFLWTGTNSFIQPQRVMELPLNILLIVIGVGWICHAAKAKTIPSVDIIAGVTLILFVISLMIHLLAYIALLGAFVPGAWYIHCLAPLLAPLVSLGLADAWRRGRTLVSALVIYPVLLLPYVTALELFYVAGCFEERTAVAQSGLTTLAACAASPHEVLGHLAVVGSPGLSIPLFGAGWVAMLMGVMLVIARLFSFRSTARHFLPMGATISTQLLRSTG